MLAIGGPAVGTAAAASAPSSQGTLADMPCAGLVPPPSSGSVVKRQGTIGCAPVVSSHPQSGRGAESIPAGWCWGAYEAWSNYGEQSVNYESAGQCLTPILRIGTYAKVSQHGGKNLIAHNADSNDNSGTDFTIATSKCGNDCGQGFWQGANMQTFVLPPGLTWGTPIGACVVVSPDTMVCSSSQAWKY